jgi:hypothetical protein
VLGTPFGRQITGYIDSKAFQLECFHFGAVNLSGDALEGGGDCGLSLYRLRRREKADSILGGGCRLQRAQLQLQPRQSGGNQPGAAT